MRSFYKQMVRLILALVVFNICLPVLNVYSKETNEPQNITSNIEIKDGYYYIKSISSAKIIKLKLKFYNANDSKYILACLNDAGRKFVLINKSTLKIRTTDYSCTKQIYESSNSVSPIIGCKNGKYYFISGNYLVRSNGIKEEKLFLLGGTNKDGNYNISGISDVKQYNNWVTFETKGSATRQKSKYAFNIGEEKIYDYIASDEYYSFYFNNGKIHSIHWNGTEEDNSVFPYNNYLYFQSYKGIYRINVEKSHFELLIKDGTGHLGGTSSVITKVEKGAVYGVQYSIAGNIDFLFRIAGDSNWVEPIYFRQINSTEKFCFNDRMEVCLYRISDNKIIFIPFSETPILYDGYYYFSYCNQIYRVTAKGEGFECIFTSVTDNAFIKIQKISNGVLFYNDSQNSIVKNLEIKCETDQ